MRLIGIIRNGVPGDAIGRMAEAMMVPRKQMYDILNMSPRTAQRSAASHLDIDKSDHLVQIAKVHSRCMDIFEDPAKAVTWLQTPNCALGGRSPFSIMDTSEGIGLVLDSLTRLEYGVFG